MFREGPLNHSSAPDRLFLSGSGLALGPPEDCDVPSAYREPAYPHGRRASDRLRVPASVQADVVHLVHLVKARWALFRNVCLAVIGLALLAVVFLPSVYSTSAVVMLEQRKNNVTEQSSVLSETPTDPASIQNQIQLLTSRDLAARVVDELDLEDDPEFAGGSIPLNPLHWFEPMRPSKRTSAA